ncbi:MAG: YebC/PmpR family DNA-binding transcriptional regulator [Candidatus Paceibacterota bacterium]
MSGHNKWSKIKHKKASEDSKKSKEFSRLAQLISIEARNANGNESAPALRKAMERARAINMPSSNIKRAVRRGSLGTGDALEEVVYEAYGPGGVAMIIFGFTDNKNRSCAQIKNILTKQGFALAEPGSATWAFEKQTEGWEAKTKIAIKEDEQDTLHTLIEILLEEDFVDEVHTNAE